MRDDFMTGTHVRGRTHIEREESQGHWRWANNSLSEKHLIIFVEIPSKICPPCHMTSHCALCLTLSNPPYIDMLRTKVSI